MGASALPFRRRVVTALAATLAAMPVCAQQGRSSALEEMVVTAQKRVENIQETPIAISAFGSEALENIGATDVRGLADRAPNVQLLASPASSITAATGIRGVISGETTIAQDAKVGMYLDGVYLGKNTGAIFDIVDIERVEVLRGPQGTLYGKNTTGGAINIVSARPKGEFGFKEMFSYGNNGLLRSNTTLDTPEIAGLSAKLTYLNKTFDGVAVNTYPGRPGELGRQDVEAWRVALLWQPTDALTVEYAIDRTDGEAVPRPAQLSFAEPSYAQLPVIDPLTGDLLALPGPDHPFQQVLDSGVVQAGNKRLGHLNLDFQGDERYDLQGQALTLSYDLDRIELKSITAYREMDVHVRDSDLDGGAWSLPLFHSAIEALGGNRKSHNQFSQEFQFIGEALDGDLEYVVGLYYFKEDGFERENLFAALVQPADPATGELLPVLIDLSVLPQPDALGEWYTIDNKSRAVYGQATYTPPWMDSRWSFTLGLRQTWDEKKSKVLLPDGSIAVDTTPPVTGPFVNSKKWNSFNPSATVTFALDEDINVYAKIATGYTAGSHPVRASTLDGFLITADQEDIIDYELGLKSDWFGQRLRINAAAFWYDYQDLQVNDFQAGSTVVTNAGQATQRGFELDVVAIPVEGLTTDFSYGYLDVDYDEFLATVNVPGTDRTELVDVADSARAPNAPRHTGRLALTYEFPALAFGRFIGMIEGTYSDGYHFNPRLFAHDAADSRTLLNARLTLADIPLPAGELRLALWGRNLENKQYRDFGIDFGELGIAVNQYGDPRSHGLDLIYEY